ncbi:MAG: rhomboid family intramembrane serine protease [Verrucomicrobiota bacterium]|jgi:membrane associated rhomboid family serine protease
MKRLWHRFLTSLTPGVRLLLCILSAVYLAALVGKFTHTYNLYCWLALSGANFRQGQIWRVATYPLLPAAVFDFVFNSLMIILLGGLLERIWSRAELAMYCAVAVVGAGLAKVILPFSDSSPTAGAGPLVFGLLAAWGRLFGHEKVPLGAFGEMTVRQLALLAGAISLVTVWLSAGLGSAVVILSAGLAGLFYLWLRAKLLMARKSRVVYSERMNRLEL